MYILRVQTKTRHVYYGPTNLHHYTPNSHINSGRILLRSKHAARLHTHFSLFLFTSFRKNPSWKVTLSFRSEFFCSFCSVFFFNCSDLLIIDVWYCWFDSILFFFSSYGFWFLCLLLIFFVRFLGFFYCCWFVCYSYIVVWLLTCKMW